MTIALPLKRLYSVAAASLLASVANSQQLLELDLKLGLMADYGASPWYTENITIGSDVVNLSLDNGADFIGATSTNCTSQACDAHNNVNTSQSGFQWIDQTPVTRSFGPWGSMTTWTGSIAFSAAEGKFPSVNFFASIDYQGAEFESLAWDGGIGLPARSTKVTSPSAFFPKVLSEAGYMPEPIFSQVTHPEVKEGSFILGGIVERYISDENEVTLTPDVAIGEEDAWGTRMDSFAVGDTPIASLEGATFFLDTGSSRFKGDQEYVSPVLNALADYKDASGNAIFEQVMEDGQVVALAYASGKPADYVNLPDIVLRLGTDCGNEAGKGAVITLSPEQYSYNVEVGERFGQWVVAFRVLDGIGGLLVGSTFLDLFYSSYQYNVDDQRNYTQGNMKLYTKSPVFGPGPAGFECE